jgi:hypothetical protein
MFAILLFLLLCKINVNLLAILLSGIVHIVHIVYIVMGNNKLLQLY